MPVTGASPERRHIYRNEVTDSSRWDGFTPRGDDIFVCTPPKSGTTWMQAICALLVFGRDDPALKPSVLSPWLDATFEPLEDTLAMLEAQTHRRIIKTHTPLDGIPFFEGCTYLAVYRDPRDVFLSMRNHVRNMTREIFLENAIEDVHEDFPRWLARTTTPEDYDGSSLAGVVWHYRSYATFAAHPDIHLLHYADLRRDLSGEMATIADILGISHSPATMAALAEAASFEHMQRNADRFAPGAGLGRWKDERRFFNKGENAQWQELLSAGEIARYEACVADLLGLEEAAWLHTGDPA